MDDGDGDSGAGDAENCGASGGAGSKGVMATEGDAASGSLAAFDETDD